MLRIFWKSLVKEGLQRRRAGPNHNNHGDNNNNNNVGDVAWRTTAIAVAAISSGLFGTVLIESRWRRLPSSSSVSSSASIHIYTPTYAINNRVVWYSPLELWLSKLMRTRIVCCEEIVKGSQEEDPNMPSVENGDDVQDEETGYTEAERFAQCLDYHRSLLFDYRRRWGPTELELSMNNNDNSDSDLQTNPSTSTNKVPRNSAWPRHVPTSDDIHALETDLQFCLRSPDQDHQLSHCFDLQFRIASYYLTFKDDPVSLRKGFQMIKRLAEQGHPDSMCYCGILLNEGKIPRVEANPKLAVVWWRRCVDYHRHIKATFELANANYLGEGTPENPELAVKLYRRAAHLGDAGAAYMLGECLVDGVGVERDRENALEWLVTAAELGHGLARERVFTILLEDNENLDAGKANEERLQAEAVKWINLHNEQKVKAVNMERRYSIGGGSRNPQVMARRQTKVQESRDEAPL